MRRTLCIAALALGFLLPVVQAPGEPATPPAKNASPPTATLLLLTEGRPLLIAVDMQIDGQSVQAAFEAARAVFLDKLFTWLDRNNDKTLDATEAARLPMSLLSIPGLQPAELEALHIAYNFEAIDADGSGKVSKTELRDFLSEFGMNSLSVAVDNMVRAIPANSQTQFFKAMDSDGDGKLSAKELEAAAKLVAKHDKDEDERLDIYEIIGGGPPVEPEFAALIEMQRPRAPSTTPARVVVVEPDRPRGTIGNLLLSHYRSARGRNDATALTVKEIGLDADTFKALDRDKDGQLDVEELDQFTNRKPDCVLTARMGKRDAKTALLDGADKSGPVRIPGEGQFRVPGMLWVEGRVLRGQVDESLVASLTRGYKLEFDAADRNGDGKIDAAERKTSRLFSTIGEGIDRDGNGVIDQREVGDWVDQIVQPLAQVLTNRASLTISQPGNGLWDLLDANRDGFLSERELRRAAALLKELDRNGDGQLQAEEVPGAYQVMVARGEATLSSRGQLVRLDLAPDGRLTYPSRQDIGGPTWFRKMDRNGDGDVSTKEFLGTPAQFAKLDRDGDGLISLEEAEAAQK